MLTQVSHYKSTFTFQSINILIPVLSNLLLNPLIGEEEEKGPKNLIQKFLATKYQRLVTLFLLLRSILNMSRCQENLKDEIKNNLLDLVSECISTEVHFEVSLPLRLTLM